jgi:hypothetical protein
MREIHSEGGRWDWLGSILLWIGIPMLLVVGGMLIGFLFGTISPEPGDWKLLLTCAGIGSALTWVGIRITE